MNNLINIKKQFLIIKINPLLNECCNTLSTKHKLIKNTNANIAYSRNESKRKYNSN